MAIVLVVLYHCKTRISGGYIGVDVFFVISGFVITSQLLRELTTHGRISLPQFYARRARRILPAATLATVVTTIAAVVLLSPLAALRVIGDARAAALFGANIHFAAQSADYFNATLPPSPLQHYWSLSVEEQFYLMWPVLLLVASLMWLRLPRGRAHAARVTIGSGPRTQPRLYVVALVVGALLAISLLESIRRTPTSPASAYYAIFTRAWELSAGVLLALAVPITARLNGRAAGMLTCLGLGCITLAALAYTGHTSYPGSAALLPVAGAVLVIGAGGAATTRWRAETVLGSRPFQRVGGWSYSWYLWHWPLLVLAPSVLGHALSELEALEVAAISLVVAVLGFVLVESPIRRAQSIVRRPALGLAGGAALVAASVATVTLASPTLGPVGPAVAVAAPAVGVSHQLTEPQLAKDLAAGNKTRRLPANLNPPLSAAADAAPIIVKNGCHLQYPEVRSKPCVYGVTHSPTSVVLFGDSHAATWFPALDMMSKQQRWRLVDFTKYACAPPDVVILWAGTRYPQCPKWRRDALRRIAALRPALVIMAGARYLSALARPLAGVPVVFKNVWKNGLHATIRFLQVHTPATRIIFISDVPTLSESDPDCVSAHPSDVRACDTRRSDAVTLPGVKADELAVAKHDHIPVIDPTDWFCAPTWCPAVVGNIILYRDDAHMVPQWSSFIEPVLSGAIMRILGPTTS